MIEFFTHIEVKVKVQAWVVPSSPQTRHDPGNREYVDELKVEIVGDLEDYVDEEELSELVFDELAEMKAEHAARRFEDSKKELYDRMFQQMGV